MVIAQMATGTAGRQLSTTKQPTQAVFSAAVARLANITHWRPRLPQLQLSGTWKQLVAHLTARWLKAIRLEICTARCVATIGKPHPISGSARMLAAHSAQTQKGIARPSTQPLQNAKTHEEELSWQNSMRHSGSFPKMFSYKAISRSSGFALSVQQDRSTADR